MLEPIGDVEPIVYAWPDAIEPPAARSPPAGQVYYFFYGFVTATHIVAPLLLWLFFS